MVRLHIRQCRSHCVNSNSISAPGPCWCRHCHSCRHLELRPKLQQRRRWRFSSIGLVLQSMVFSAMETKLISMTSQHARQGCVKLQSHNNIQIPISLTWGQSAHLFFPTPQATYRTEVPESAHIHLASSLMTPAVMDRHGLKSVYPSSQIQLWLTETPSPPAN